MNTSPSGRARSRAKYLLLVVPAALGLAVVWLVQPGQDSPPASAPTATAPISAIDGYGLRWLPANFAEIGRGSERTRLTTAVASAQPAASVYVPPTAEAPNATMTYVDFGGTTSTGSSASDESIDAPGPAISVMVTRADDPQVASVYWDIVRTAVKEAGDVVSVPIATGGTALRPHQRPEGREEIMFLTTQGAIVQITGTGVTFEELRRVATEMA